MTFFRGAQNFYVIVTCSQISASECLTESGKMKLGAAKKLSLAEIIFAAHKLWRLAGALESPESTSKPGSASTGRGRPVLSRILPLTSVWYHMNVDLRMEQCFKKSCECQIRATNLILPIKNCLKAAYDLL